MKIDIAESLIRSWLRHVENCTVVETNWKAPSWEPDSTDRTTEWKNWFNAFKRGDILGEPVETSPNNDDPDKPAPADRNSFDQFVDKAEIDALGISFSPDGKLMVKAVDVAFHRQGLGYNKGGKNDNRHRVAKKMLRSAIIVDKYFPGLDAEIIFATPKIRGGADGTESRDLKSGVEKVQTYLHGVGSKNITLRCIFDEEFKKEILDTTIDKAESVADTSELFLRAVSLGALQVAKPTVRPQMNTPTEEEQELAEWDATPQGGLRRTVHDAAFKLFGNEHDATKLNNLLTIVGGAQRGEPKLHTRLFLQSENQEADRRRWSTFNSRLVLRNQWTDKTAPKFLACIQRIIQAREIGNE